MRAHWELFVPIVLWISEKMAHFDPFWLIEAHFCKFWPIELLRGDTQNRDKMRVNLVVFFHFSQSWEFFAELKNSAKVQNRYPCNTEFSTFWQLLQIIIWTFMKLSEHQLTDRLWITEILFTNVKCENIFFYNKNIFSMKIICPWK